jgi:hypothetical protein
MGPGPERAFVVSGVRSGGGVFWGGGGGGGEEGGDVRTLCRYCRVCHPPPFHPLRASRLATALLRRHGCSCPRLVDHTCSCLTHSGHEKPTKSSLGNAPRGLATRSRVATGHEARAACRSLLSPSVHPSRQPRPPHSPNPTCLILVHHPHPPSHHHTHHYPHSHPHEPTPPRHRPVNPRHLSPVTCHPSPLHPARASAYPTSPPRGFHFPDMPSPHHSKRPAGAVRRTRAAQRECERTGVGSGHRSGSR